MSKSSVPAFPAIEVRGLSKSYGQTHVLTDVFLNVIPGEVYALTGPNGAGKTTLIRMLTGLAFPTRGEVRVMGVNVHTDGPRARTLMGAVVEAPAKFYPQFTGIENLKIHAGLTGAGVGPGRISEVLALLELTSMGGRRVAEYSLGQRQRLGVASAILAEPRVLILDEPTSGLDPLGIGLIHRIVTSLATSGCAVILSTHHLREIATYAHTVGIMTAGRLVDTVDLRSRTSAYRFRVDDPVGAAALLERQPYVRRAVARPPYAVAQLGAQANVPEALRLLANEDVAVYEVTPDHFDLYEYYRERVEYA
ncbi:ABC transporter ATP-binding protein [Deinococcus wulumuqiensis]|uniref:ABC transporter ATP-binding protein n=1 Tax=Deinococcus wulumuqiensis TaxID=980427 RepID=A0A345IGJ8_9DEIO|nr:ABC transporter ATP-binding protein [Deinococcus wulumuqiensis]AXG98820.1 ABC transporter ATP-binding protein [Deinococcus wulumuqiensis]QII20536.1 ABC transporter ATP-binding protein [Deinococcus wulumuqiensis R12]GGI72054.1 ABC transporter ATP-binding protein [Deinococcus wulumuqiensis]GGP30952.1 ABC transporter ATP-binding protein [Deinococcus wulumuqiensis]